MLRFKHSTLFLIFGFTSLPLVAFADVPSTRSPQTREEEPLPAPIDDNDPRPPVAKPPMADEVTQQAGIGGTQAYGRRGVLELGGAFGFTSASDFSQVNFTPSIGWFLVDDLEASLLLGYNRVSADGEKSDYFTALVEPSLHLPLDESLFIFGGLGVGGAYAEGPGAGFAVAPRLGLNVMVGRSGVFTPAFNFTWATGDVIQTPSGSLLAVNTSYGFNAGYTVMW